MAKVVLNTTGVRIRDGAVKKDLHTPNRVVSDALRDSWIAFVESENGSNDESYALNAILTGIKSANVAYTHLLVPDMSTTKSDKFKSVFSNPNINDSVMYTLVAYA